MSSAAARHTAGERREEILAAAVARFGATGLHGTSTETIARDVGVSQPYVFRLFGTKKGLFKEAVAWGFRETVRAFREATREASDPRDAFRRMAAAYAELIGDRRYLDLQMQAYAACDDPEIRAVVVAGFGELVEEIVRRTDATPDQLASFLGKGMLLNVTAAMGVGNEEEGWPRLVREGCVGRF
ncbi:TetR family transcriptional regulator [soil metagenome]